MLTIRRAGNTLQKANVWVKLMIYAESGVGKTWAAVKARKPLVLLTEKNGYASAAHSNPDALILECNTPSELRNIIMDIRDHESKYLVGKDENGNELKAEFDTLVIDSLTEIQRLFKEEIMKNNGRELFSQQDWGKLADTMRKLIRSIRDSDCHVVCTALQDSFIEEATGTRHVKPMFEGRKTQSEILQFFSGCGYLVKRNTQEDGRSVWKRHLIFDGPSHIVCKPCHPVGGVIEDPNIAEIIDLISGQEKDIEQSETIKKQKEMPTKKTKTNGRRRSKGE